MLDLGVVLAFRVLKLFVGLLNQQFKKLCFFLNVVWNVYISDSSGNCPSVWRFSRSDVSHLFLQYLDCLWSQIQKLKKDRWQERHILRPYLAFDSVLCEALQHNLPPFTPPPHTEDSVYPMPRVIFRMFDYTDDPEVRDCCGEWWVDFTIFPGAILVKMWCPLSQDSEWFEGQQQFCFGTSAEVD